TCHPTTTDNIWNAVVEATRVMNRSVKERTWNSGVEGSVACSSVAARTATSMPGRGSATLTLRSARSIQCREFPLRRSRADSDCFEPSDSTAANPLLVRLLVWYSAVRVCQLVTRGTGDCPCIGAGY